MSYDTEKTDMIDKGHVKFLFILCKRTFRSVNTGGVFLKVRPPGIFPRKVFSILRIQVIMTISVNMYVYHFYGTAAVFSQSRQTEQKSR